ncbi:MAG TPA: hypothetical protein VMM17_12965 [Gemmatimonadaceae bacterium]|nr:hypothetical protein [Gemmatimonadaceae bacterium]
MNPGAVSRYVYLITQGLRLMEERQYDEAEVQKIIELATTQPLARP